jgi:hypothetical protein
MLANSSASSSSRIVGDDILVVKRKNTENNISHKVEKSSERSLTDDEVTVQDLISQLGPNADIESIPDSVLTAFGLSKNQLRRAESVDVKAPLMSNLKSDKRKHVPKSTQDFDVNSSEATPVRNVNNSGTSRQNTIPIPMYFRRFSPEDDVSWVERSQRLNQANTSSHTNYDESSMSSSKRELATDDRGPIPEPDILEEVFSGSSKGESLSESFKSLMQTATESDGHKSHDSTIERDHQFPEVPCTHSPSDEALGGMKPSLGFMRHSPNRDFTKSVQDDIEVAAMDKRSEILTLIEIGRAQIRKFRERDQGYY